MGRFIAGAANYAYIRERMGKAFLEALVSPKEPAATRPCRLGPCRRRQAFRRQAARPVYHSSASLELVD